MVTIGNSFGTTGARDPAFLDIRGLSTAFLEMDTGDIYFWDKDAEEWRKL